MSFSSPLIEFVFEIENRYPRSTEDGIRQQIQIKTKDYMRLGMTTIDALQGRLTGDSTSVRNVRLKKKLKRNEVSYGHCYVLVNHHI